MIPDISIIIPAYNEEKYLPQTLHSLKSQTFQNFETIIVTNGCIDKTEELVKKKVNERFRHLSLPKANVSVARNAGALNANGKILIFLDADTQLEPDALQKIRNEFTEKYSVASTKSRPDTTELKYKIVFGFKNFYLRSLFYHGCSGVLICRKEYFQKVGGYNPEIIVREHRKLILKLESLGKFKCINTMVTTSTRRFQQWGLAKTSFFWINQWIKDKIRDIKNTEYEKVR